MIKFQTLEVTHAREKDIIAEHGRPIRMVETHHSKHSVILDLYSAGQAVVGDYLIVTREYLTGSCKLLDIVQVARIGPNVVHVVGGQKLASGVRTEGTWNYTLEGFKLLSVDNSETQSGTPRMAVATKHVAGFPLGTRITGGPNIWRSTDSSCSKEYAYSIGTNCEWLQLDQREKWLGCKVKVTHETRDKIVAKLYAYGLATAKCETELPKEADTTIAAYLLSGSGTRHWINSSSDRSNFYESVAREIYWDNTLEDFSDVPEASLPSAPAVCEDAMATDYYRMSQAAVSTMATVQNRCNGARATYIGTPDLCCEVLAPSFKQSNQTNKGTTMSREKITIEIDADMICKEVEEEPKTDLEQSSKVVVAIFRPNGTLYCMANDATLDTVKKIRADLQSPTKIGFTYKMFKLHKTFTTDIPILES